MAWIHDGEPPTLRGWAPASAVAFVATIYVRLPPTLVFLPIAKKLGAHIVTLTTQREMFVDGLVGIPTADNLRIIASRMQGCVA